jgi:hypothetical protein
LLDAGCEIANDDLGAFVDTSNFHKTILEDDDRTYSDLGNPHPPNRIIVGRSLTRLRGIREVTDMIKAQLAPSMANS